jgi:hypothetical protein
LEILVRLSDKNVQPTNQSKPMQYGSLNRAPLLANRDSGGFPMMPRILAIVVAGFCALAALGDDSELPVKKTGRPGENTPEEEAKLDKIIDNFIQYDTGARKNAAALAELNSLGPEAIPALIRGLNKCVKLGYSCPIASISRKLRQLLQATEDDKVLDFARIDIGAGVGRTTPYDPILRDLKVTTMLRKKQLADLRKAARNDVPTTGSYGNSSREDKSK